MKHSRLTTSAALALAIAAVAAPTASAYTDLRSPDTRDAAQAAGSVQSETGQNLRSPDANDAARAAGSVQSEPVQNLRAPDTNDAAVGRGTFSAPEVTVVRLSESAPSSDGLDWGDAGIGAGALFGLILLGMGSTLAVMQRRQGGLRRSQATTG
jgi:hypothetical protein